MRQRLMGSIINIFQGLAIGIANVIPGVSGGTIAVLVGIYEQLIEALADFFSPTGKRISSLMLLSRIALGAMIGILLFTRLIDFVFSNHSLQATLFFIGLVLGSVPVLYRLSGRIRPGFPAIAAFLLAAAAVSVTGFLRPAGSDIIINTIDPASAIQLFVSGFFTLATMIIPGISGAFVLLAMGMYKTIVNAVNDLNILLLGIFFIGGVAGVLSLSKLIRFLLARFHHVTYFGILGLVFGSAVTLWPKEPLVLDAAGMIGIFCLLAGAALAVGLGKIKAGKQTDMQAEIQTDIQANND